ncbi:TetR/AcrR family transcriptional regulator [Mameliella sp. CS4]|uniref:TetR/AcrR family transcriptional regulator n=1 Tax=Mameliella sp. CS4 TaxID=2862329 RepID=UPI001C5DDEA5|nr:TetR/AcrR family transcriptional regulator [Mameliella sp. CS4]MBW4982686.1 TetR/AcrR family transcriptional regulator [Mameliella sp. CS4]
MSFIKPRSTETTRDRLLTAAEMAILDKGFAATSIEELIAEVGITKGGFFYHFKDKSALIEAILKRHLGAEEAWLDELFARAAEQSEDPLGQFLAFLRLLRAQMEALPDVHPGCLIAATCFQERLFTQTVHDLAQQNLLSWRRRFHARLAEIARGRPLRQEIDLEALADMLVVLVDGAIILSKTVREKEALPRQIALYEVFVSGLFTEAG